MEIEGKYYTNIEAHTKDLIVTSLVLKKITSQLLTIDYKTIIFKYLKNFQWRVFGY